MSDPFLRTWIATFGELTGNPKPPDGFPFGTTEIEIDIEVSNTSPYKMTIKAPGGLAIFPASPVPGTSHQITAEGPAANIDPLGYFRFHAFLLVGLLPDEEPLITCAFTRTQPGPPGDDPPATGGWVGGPESSSPKT